jgi:hypothetical protein
MIISEGKAGSLLQDSPLKGGGRGGGGNSNKHTRFITAVIDYVGLSLTTSSNICLLQDSPLRGDCEKHTSFITVVIDYVVTYNLV